MPYHRLFSFSAVGLAVILLSAGIALTLSSVMPVHAAQTQPQEKPPQDHSKFSTLRKPFESPEAVTQACLGCHPNAARQVVGTQHWLWVNPTTGIGKRNLLSNTVLGISSNESLCTTCHVGYGWQDSSFDLTREQAVDCLVCHDTTGEYRKLPGGQTLGAEILMQIAQKVGPTSTQSCGACHFVDSENPLAHGSLAADVAVHDVHLNSEDSSCTDCHRAEEHRIAGVDTPGPVCMDCHDKAPHQNPLLNRHTDRLSCELCHIPYISQDVAVPTHHDWSTVGAFQSDGLLQTTRDDSGNIIYDTRWGSYTWQSNLRPQALWWNGSISVITLTQTVDSSGVTVLNPMAGSRSDSQARLFPVWAYTARQPYDQKRKVLVNAQLEGADTALWSSFDWNTAIAAGMAAAGQEYSGTFDWADTVMLRPLFHGIRTAAQAVQCAECHTADDNRLNFVALGYTVQEAERLANFPPNLAFTTPEGQLVEDTPEYCAECHEAQHTQWTRSNHGSGNVGCLACHEKIGTEDHPLAPFSVDRTEYTCGTCHLDYLTDWKQSKHGQTNITCISCHEAHTQEQRVLEGNQTTCETCHKDQKEAVSHSTHQAAGLLCSDCHTNSEVNTGHTFTVASDTCLLCHAEEIHTANQLVLAGQVEPAPMPVETQPAPIAAPNVITFPIWMAVILGIFLGFGGFWVIAGRNPGDQHPENH